MWYIPAEGAHAPLGLLFYTRKSLFPVFAFSEEETLDRNFSLPYSLAVKGLHAMQGISFDIALLEAVLEKKGLKPSEQIVYDLMSLEYAQALRAADAGRRGLVIRKPGEEDLDALFPLQQGYEMEEVLPEGAEFNPQSCRRNLENLVRDGTILAAEQDGALVGKINVNAESFTRFQIGGVYVAREFRGRGIAQGMTEAMLQYLLPQGKSFTLFVKKHNAAARRVYEKTGFVKTADYGIDYFL
jgi:predicted GNAT family acetyltransferase